jgi:hypothetical protein
LPKALTTYNYMMKSRTHGTTPNEAREQKNHLDIKMNLEAGAVKKRKYPAISVGDQGEDLQEEGEFRERTIPRLEP